jgi:protein-tyrosine phosphatase
MSTWFRTYGFADILDDLLVGAYPLDEADVAMLARLGIKRVMNLVEDDEYREGERQVVQAAFDASGIEERRRTLVDYGGLPAEEIEAAALEIRDWLDEGVRTYLHCRAGWQRSAAVAAAVVALQLRVDIDDALAYVQRRKPSADPLPHQRENLRQWWDERDPDAAA